MRSDKCTNQIEAALHGAQGAVVRLHLGGLELWLIVHPLAGVDAEQIPGGAGQGCDEDGLLCVVRGLLWWTCHHTCDAVVDIPAHMWHVGECSVMIRYLVCRVSSELLTTAQVHVSCCVL